MYIYIYVYICMYVYIHIYIYGKVLRLQLPGLEVLAYDSDGRFGYQLQRFGALGLPGLRLKEFHLSRLQTLTP